MTRPDIDALTRNAPDGQLGIAMGRGLLIGVLLVFPALMGLFAIVFQASGTAMVAVAAGTLFMAALIGVQIGMGLWGDMH